MAAKILVKYDLVNEADVPRPCVLSQRRRQGEVEPKIRIHVSQVSEIVGIKNFLARSRAVPEADPARRLAAFKQVRQMSTER